MVYAAARRAAAASLAHRHWLHCWLPEEPDPRLPWALQPDRIHRRQILRQQQQPQLQLRGK